MVQTSSILALDSTDEMSTSIPPPKKCSFLELPAELRNRIYEEVMHKPFNSRFGICIYRRCRRSYHESPGALVATCRQIRDEALAIYFKVNRFTFYLRRERLPRACDPLDPCIGQINRCIHNMKDILIWTGEYDHMYYFRIDLSAGLNKDVLQLEDTHGTSVVPIPHQAVVHMDKARQMLAKVINKVGQDDTIAVLDRHILESLIGLLVDACRDRIAYPFSADDET